jgi:hypothetical protein
MNTNAITAALANLNSALELTRAIKKFDVSLRLDFDSKVAELVSILADTKEQLAEVKVLVVEKESEIRTLHEQLAVKDKLEYEEPYYWIVSDGIKNGPYCQHCYDKHDQLIRLQSSGRRKRTGYWECLSCNKGYFDNDYVAPEKPTPRTTRRPRISTGDVVMRHPKQIRGATSINSSGGPCSLVNAQPYQAKKKEPNLAAERRDVYSDAIALIIAAKSEMLSISLFAEEVRRPRTFYKH